MLALMISSELMIIGFKAAVVVFNFTLVVTIVSAFNMICFTSDNHRLEAPKHFVSYILTHKYIVSILILPQYMKEVTPSLVKRELISRLYMKRLMTCLLMNI